MSVVIDKSSLGGLKESMSKSTATMKPAVAVDPHKVKHMILFVVYGGGIYFFYMWYAILQEKITKTKFGVDEEKFSFFATLIFLQCVGNLLPSAIVLLYNGSTRGRSSMEQKPQIREYLYMSVSYCLAMIFSNSALKFINYPTQVLAKCCKMIPIMLMGLILHRAKYKTVEYVCVLLLTAGISAFMLANKKADSRINEIEGILLILGSLIADGFTGSSQEKLLRQYKPTAHEMMFYMNMWSALLVGCYAVLSGELFRALDFCSRNPELYWDLAVLSTFSAFGQNFIFLTIEEFGALICSIITTTRKFFTILASVLWYGHPLSNVQWGCVGLVFLSISVQMYYKFKAKSRQAAEAAAATEKKTM
eukprot:GFYU01003703.1.p1 GENE.GFYU01003703.1~~GFYU01003703.1.p1  ORF type:complete len:363 (+),score=60.86 GFYU01003703.1:65-1153(+)